MAYATVTELEARWRPLTADEKTRAEALLEDAAFDIDREFPQLLDADGAPIPFTEQEQQARKVVSVDMVKRAMAVGDSMLGVTSHSDGTGPFQEQRTFANPMGDLYLTKKDRRRLGAGQIVTSVPMHSLTSTPLWWEL